MTPAFWQDLALTVVGATIAAGGGGIAVYTQLGVTQQRRETRNLILDSILTLELGRAAQALHILDTADPAIATAYTDSIERPTGILRNIRDEIERAASAALRGSRWDSRIIRRVAAEPDEPSGLDLARQILAIRLYLQRRLRTGTAVTRFAGWLTDQRELQRRHNTPFLPEGATAAVAYDILRRSTAP